MKLRLRFQKCTKILTIETTREDSFTVSDLIAATSQLFEDIVFGDFNLSLNNKDILKDYSKRLVDFEIVSGDLVYIICNTAQQADNVSSQKPLLLNSTQASVSSESLSTGQSATGIGNHGNCQADDTTMETESSQADAHSRAAESSNIEMDLEPAEPIDLDIVNQCLSEPILCRESSAGSVPSSLREVFEASQPTDGMEALCVVLHVLMVETGFMVHPESKTSGHSSLPDTWRHPGYFKFTYTYPGCTDVTCCITVLSTGTLATVHGKVIGSDESTRVCSLRTTDFIQGISKDCSTCYTQLAKLSRIFKDCVASLLVHDVRTAAGQEDIFGLVALTQELQLRILSFLDVKSLLQTSLVNTELCMMSKDPHLWRRHYLRTFGNRNDNSLSQDWKKIYIDKYKIRKERRKMMSRMTMIRPPAWGPQNPFSGPSNWIPPGPGGIIGGDYDLYPNFPNSLPGVPGRAGPRPYALPHPRYDLIGPNPDLNPNPDFGLIPRRPGAGRGGTGRNNPSGGMGMGPTFF